MKVESVTGESPNILYHGTSASIDAPVVIPFRTRKGPKDTSMFTHNSINNASIMRFGVAVRNLFFASMRLTYSEMYGDVYEIEPVDEDAKLYFNRNVYDLTMEIPVNPIRLLNVLSRHNFKFNYVSGVSDSSDLEDYYNACMKTIKLPYESLPKNIKYVGSNYEKDQQDTIDALDEEYNIINGILQEYIAGLEVCTYKEFKKIKFKGNVEIMIQSKSGIRFLRAVE